MAIVGLEKLYYATVIKDDENELVYGTPKYLAGVREIGASPSVNTEKLYAENKLWEQDSAIESVDVTIDLADLTNAESANLLGHKLAETGGVIGSEDDIAPYIALLYKANKSNGASRFQVLYKGKFELPNDDAKGKEGQTSFQTPQMTATFQPTRNSGVWKYQVDSDDADVSETIEEDFFKEVIIAKEKAIELAPSLSATASKGTTSGTTKIKATKGGGNSLATVIQASAVATPNVGEVISSATAYVSEDELEVEANDHVGVYELDAESKVVKFVSIKITALEIAE